MYNSINDTKKKSIASLISKDDLYKIERLDSGLYRLASLKEENYTGKKLSVEVTEDTIKECLERNIKVLNATLYNGKIHLWGDNKSETVRAITESLINYLKDNDSVKMEFNRDTVNIDYVSVNNELIPIFDIEGIANTVSESLIDDRSLHTIHKIKLDGRQYSNNGGTIDNNSKAIADSLKSSNFGQYILFVFRDKVEIVISKYMLGDLFIDYDKKDNYRSIVPIYSFNDWVTHGRPWTDELRLKIDINRQQHVIDYSSSIITIKTERGIKKAAVYEHDAKHSTGKYEEYKYIDSELTSEEKALINKNIGMYSSYVLMITTINGETEFKRNMNDAVAITYDYPIENYIETTLLRNLPLVALASDRTYTRTADFFKAGADDFIISLGVDLALNEKLLPDINEKIIFLTDITTAEDLPSSTLMAMPKELASKLLTSTKEVCERYRKYGYFTCDLDKSKEYDCSIQYIIGRCCSVPCTKVVNNTTSNGLMKIIAALINTNIDKEVTMVIGNIHTGNRTFVKNTIGLFRYLDNNIREYTEDDDKDAGEDDESLMKHIRSAYYLDSMEIVNSFKELSAKEIDTLAKASKTEEKFEMAKNKISLLYGDNIPDIEELASKIRAESKHLVQF